MERGPDYQEPARDTTNFLERLQESDELVLLRGAQRTIVVDDSRGFATVTQNRIVSGKRKQIMHQPVTRPAAPKRRGAHEVSCSLSTVLDNPISRSHVMQQEVAVGMDDLAPQSCRHGEGAAIDDGTCRGSRD